MPKRSADTVQEMRREAVRRRLAGDPLAAVKASTGLSIPTIIAAHRQFMSGGWDAVSARSRGRVSGEGRILGAADEGALLRQMAQSAPDQIGLPFPLWQVQAVTAWVQWRTGRKASDRSLGNYLSRWGLGGIKPFDRLHGPGELLKHWRESVYPEITARAHAEGAQIFWVDEVELGAGAAGDTAHMPRPNAIRGVDLRGKQYWRGHEGALRAPVLSDFLERLREAAGGNIFVVLDNRPWRRAHLLSAWLAKHSGRILTFHLPAHSTGPEESTGRTGEDHPPPEPPIDVPVDSFASQLRFLTSQQPREPHRRTAHVAGESHEPPPLTRLQRLEAEAIDVLREAASESDKPVMLHSMGKDSSVMLHLAVKAFYPAKPPFPILHVDTTWNFRETYAQRDRLAADERFQLLIHVNPDGLAKHIDPFTHGPAVYTEVMKTDALKQALEQHAFDMALAGSRRDEEKSRAKERIFSLRSSTHRWDPRLQRPEVWHLYNARKSKGERLRIFPLSNWTELDIWRYIEHQRLSVSSLYFAAWRPVVVRHGTLIVVDDARLPLRQGEAPEMRRVRFRSLGCYPLTGAIESSATSVADVIRELSIGCGTSERQGRIVDHDDGASMEQRKQRGHF